MLTKFGLLIDFLPSEGSDINNCEAGNSI